MKTETIEYKDGSLTLRGYLAYDDQKSGKRPGVLVMPEAFGLGKNAKSRAEQLAKLGYVALAGDPYGNGEELSDLQEAIKRATAIFTEPGMARRRMRVGLEKLASLPQTDPTRLAAIGYCMPTGRLMLALLIAPTLIFVAALLIMSAISSSETELFALESRRDRFLKRLVHLSPTRSFSMGIPAKMEQKLWFR